MIDLSSFETGKYVNSTREVLGNKESLIKWLEGEIGELNKRGNLELKNIKNTNGLYERRGWSRPSKDGKNKVKLRIEVRGKSAFFDEESCKSNRYILVDNDFNVVKSSMERLLDMVKKENEIDLYYTKKNELGTKVVAKM